MLFYSTVKYCVETVPFGYTENYINSAALWDVLNFCCWFKMRTVDWARNRMRVGYVLALPLPSVDSRRVCFLDSRIHRVPENNLPYLHKRPQIRMLLLSALCIGVSITWMVFRNEDQWVESSCCVLVVCVCVCGDITVQFFTLCGLMLTCCSRAGWRWCGLTHSLVMCPPGGRGCYRTPWGSPSVSTCSKQSDSPHLRWVCTFMN